MDTQRVTIIQLRRPLRYQCLFHQAAALVGIHGNLQRWVDELKLSLWFSSSHRAHTASKAIHKLGRRGGRHCRMRAAHCPRTREAHRCTRDTDCNSSLSISLEMAWQVLCPVHTCDVLPFCHQTPVCKSSKPSLQWCHVAYTPGAIGTITSWRQGRGRR